MVEESPSLDWVLWEKKYEMGISMLDSQNKELVDLCNQFRAEIMRRGEGSDWRAALGVALKGAVKYTKGHFVAQERMMQQIDYPKFQQHKRYHQLFIDMVVSTLESFPKATMQTAIEFSANLREWIISHVAHDDQEFAKYFFDPNRKKKV